MKIPQGLFKKTGTDQLNVLFQIHQIWEKNVSLKKRKKEKSEIILLLQSKSDSLAAWWETL